METTQRKIDLANDERLGQDEFGSLLVSEWLPKYARLAAAGRLFAVDTHAGTAKAPVVAAPTTSPEWGLYNFSQDDMLVVLEAAATIKSGTQGLGLALMMATALGLQTAVTSDYAASVKNATDGTARKGEFYITNNPTLIGGTPPWHVVAADDGSVVAQVNIGSGLVANNLEGKFCARPGGGMVAMEVVGPTGTTALFSVSFLVAMIPLKRY